MKTRATCTVTLSSTATPPTEFLIWKIGKVETTKGTFLFDRKAAESVMSAWKAYGNDLCFDYEHRSVDPEARAGDGKAAGWFQLELRTDGLYAVNIKWTDTAAKQIAAREWRYFSPTFDFEKKSGRILELVNVALTNIPATKNLPALVAATRTRGINGDKTMSKVRTASKASAKLGTKKTKKTVTEVTEDDAADLDDAEAAKPAACDDDDAAEAASDAELDDDDDVSMDEESDDEVDADDDDDDDDDAPPAGKKAPPPPPKKMAATSSRRAAAQLANVVRELTGTDDPDEAAGALRAMRESHEQVATLSQTVDKLQRKQLRTEIRGMVETAIKSGKLTPAQRDQFVDLGVEKGPKFLKGFLSNMPKRVSMTGEELREGGGSAGPQGAEFAPLTQLEAEIADRAGVGREQFARAKKQGKTINFFDGTH